ncbi:phosphoglycerate mutase [Mycobacterium kubicae]|uniref:Acid phosphatase n=1 Tax=Mycobacterium kubicae TaxID=120959 RepID=A0AAX1JCD1_9MYCO|nr:acid phosphatase [Mycobacterium kubicae]MCV7098608.1 acid phosphatase [Mycobacterium kubicae]OBK42535.1 acid phosphatase [Mycobacterium kubicae]ORV95868.1 acid phosphatase [Mycobacterium kubicae]QNI10987.1 acid phosphatase [Mycobacterium kubicae]QPI39200.1 acid phosphatase [Mycobacterium kubicae]
MGLHDHRLVLLRHGETEWSISGQHTGRTDIDLTDDGRKQAQLAGKVLDQLDLVDPLVVSSPRKRSVDTAELAGLTVDEVSEVLAEWDYGAYEGLTTAQIQESEPDWLVWTHGCRDGETVAEVSDRADQAVALALKTMESRDVVFVSHGHFSRAVITRWVELPLVEGSRFGMATASIGILGFEHGVRQLSVLGLTGQLGT